MFRQNNVVCFLIAFGSAVAESGGIDFGGIPLAAELISGVFRWPWGIVPVWMSGGIVSMCMSSEIIDFGVYSAGISAELILGVFRWNLSGIDLGGIPLAVELKKTIKNPRNVRKSDPDSDVCNPFLCKMGW